MNTNMDNINIISRFLSKRDIASLSKEALQTAYNISSVDLLVLMGNSIPDASRIAAKAYINGLADEFILAGGNGHSTQPLRDSINEQYPSFPTKNRPEADLIIDLFEMEFGLKPGTIFVDNKSTNCGENAKFALEVAKAHNLSPKTVLLIQDPTMQLRIDASFRKEWADEGVTFINYAPFIPNVTEVNNHLEFLDKSIHGLWNINHFISLILGEIPRLTDNGSGYGPNGTGYIAHVEIPKDVEKAYRFLIDEYKTLIRK